MRQSGVVKISDGHPQQRKNRLLEVAVLQNVRAEGHVEALAGADEHDHEGQEEPEQGLGGVAQRGDEDAWEKQVLSARGSKRVGRHSEYSITVWRCIERGPGGSSEPPEPRICCSLEDAHRRVEVDEFEDFQPGQNRIDRRDVLADRHPKRELREVNVRPVAVNVRAWDQDSVSAPGVITQ